MPKIVGRDSVLYCYDGSSGEKYMVCIKEDANIYDWAEKLRELLMEVGFHEDCIDEILMRRSHCEKN